MRYLDISFEIDTKEVDEESGTFKGYGSTFGGKPDSYGDIIVEGAFSETLQKGGRNGNGVFPLLWQHDPDNPIGKWTQLAENKKGLLSVGKLTKGVQKADEALLLLKDGAINGLSIGYTIPKDGAEIDEKTRTRYIKKIDLWEISLVTFPANTRAQVTAVKKIIEAENERELEKALRDEGLSVNLSKTLVSMCKPHLRRRRAGEDLAMILDAVKSVNTDHFVQNLMR